MTITAKPITVTADPKSKVYGDSDPALTYQVTSGSLVSGDSFAGALSRDAGENVGSYTINQGTLAIDDGNGGNNYSLTYVSNVLDIAQAPLTITANDVTKNEGDTYTFDQTTPSIDFTVVGLLYQDTVDSVTLTSAGAPAGAGPGTYPIDPSSASGCGIGNYCINYVPGTLTVIAAPATAVPPYPNVEQLRYIFPPLEQLLGPGSVQVSPTDLMTSDQLARSTFFYHPLTPTDMGAFDEFILEEGAYEFIDGTIGIRGHDGLLPILEEVKKKKKTI